MIAAAPFAQYLFWELSVTALGLAAAARVRPPALKLALAIAWNITLSALGATALSFLGWNRPAAYLGLAAVFASCAAAVGWRARSELLPPPDWRVRLRAEAMAIWFALGALLALSIRPVEEVDSLYNLHYAAGWLANRTTPYHFAYNYVPFWELSYFPALVLTRGDLFLWYHSLKAVLLLALVLFLIARELELPDRFSILTIPCLLLFPHLWLGPSGVSTIKNDMIHAAGYALAALVAVRAARGKLAGVDVWLAALSAVFVSTKFSGPVVLILGGAVVLATSGRWLAANARIALLSAGAIGAGWFAAVGHYYLHNFLLYGSPVYPYQIDFGPLHLPGRADLSGTSILYSLNDVRVWRYFFRPEHGLSPDGVLFPVILLAILVGSAALAGLALWRRHVTPIAALALFELISWFVYLRSTYSASGWPGDLAFLRNELNSTRYVEGPLLIGELCLLWALRQVRLPRLAVPLLVAAQAVSSFAILVHRAPDTPWLLALLCGLALAVGSLGLRGRMLAPLTAVLATVALLGGAGLVERRRPLWLRDFQPLYLPLYEAPPQRLFYLMDDEFSQQTCWHFAMLGRHFQHDTASGSREQLAALGAPPRYVVWTRATPDAADIQLPGYGTLVRVPKGMLLERR
jgi:hypothetical protein